MVVGIVQRRTGCRQRKSQKRAKDEGTGAGARAGGAGQLIGTGDAEERAVDGRAAGVAVCSAREQVRAWEREEVGRSPVGLDR